MAFEPFNWTCPFCERPQSVTEDKVDQNYYHFWIQNHDLDSVGIATTAIACSNPYCLKLSVAVELKKDSRPNYNHDYSPLDEAPILALRLRPRSFSKTFPDYIPSPLLADYREACEIRDASPKASATLARRCLQGIIRDFCGISKSRLIDEISELKTRVENDNAPKGVSEESVEAIDHARSIGNIGAHMEKDINVIVDVDTGEAQILIELIESLFQEWYIERHKRQERFARVKEIAEEKKLAAKVKLAEKSE